MGATSPPRRSLPLPLSAPLSGSRKRQQRDRFLVLPLSVPHDVYFGASSKAPKEAAGGAGEAAPIEHTTVSDMRFNFQATW